MWSVDLVSNNIYFSSLNRLHREVAIWSFDHFNFSRPAMVSEKAVKICFFFYRRLSYVTYQDIRNVGNFADQTVMAVKAPPDTRLEVPDPKQSLQIWLKSQNGAIEVCFHD